jgi:RNase P subunit RPR2
VRRGGISLGDIHCDNCHRLIPYPERYLLIEEDEGKVSCLCTDCSLKKGYARYIEDKGQRVLTFFPEKD